MASASTTVNLQVLAPPTSSGTGAVPNESASLNDLRTAFGGVASPKLTDYYAGGAYVPNPPPTSIYQKAPIPTSGRISLGMFLGVSLAYTGVVQYPDITTQGWWWCALPKSPNGWNTTRLSLKLIGAGAGGGGGGGWGGPKSDPYGSGGGGGAGYEINTTTTDLQMGVGHFNVYIGAPGGGGAPSSHWTGNANTSRADDGAYGESSYFQWWPASNPNTMSQVNASGGNPGGGAVAAIALSSAGGGGPGGANDGQPGWGSRQGGGTASATGGRGGNSSVAAGGAGGAGLNNGSNGTGPGAGGGGGGGWMWNGDSGYGGWGGVGYSGFARIILSKAT